MRKKVLGADYVENSIHNAGEFGAPFQDMSTEFAWGSVWTSPASDTMYSETIVAGA